MFERILYIVSEKQDDKHLVIELARANDSAVFLGAIMEPESRHDVKTEGNTRQAVRREDRERQCWLDIYKVEEEMKAAGVKSSVIAQAGRLEHIQSLISTTHCDLVIIAVGELQDSDYTLPEDLLRNLSCPILITNSE